MTATQASLALDEGTHRRLVETAANDAARLRSKMVWTVQPATVIGTDRVDETFGLAAVAGRFVGEDLISIVGHLAGAGPATDVMLADEQHSTQPATSGWDRFGQ